MELLVLIFVAYVISDAIKTIRSGNRMQARNRRIMARRGKGRYSERIA